MKLREPVQIKHVHQWRIYTPQCDDADLDGLCFDAPAPPDPSWTYRRCDCGVSMRCKTSDLKAYPRDYRAYADEHWMLAGDSDEDIAW
jgi:hypothetical protein